MKEVKEEVSSPIPVNMSEYYLPDKLVKSWPESVNNSYAIRQAILDNNTFYNFN